MVTDELQAAIKKEEKDNKELPWKQVSGILEALADGFGFIRSENYLSGSEDIYVSQSQIRRFHLKTGDVISGVAREHKVGERYNALMQITSVNGKNPEDVKQRKSFETLTPDRKSVV